MDTEVQLVERFFGEPLSPDLIQLVAQADYRRLHEFREVQRRFDRSYRLPPRAPVEYRPYISADVLIFEDLNRGVTIGETSRFYESQDPGAVFKAADALQQHLLYCHTVVINSSLGFICDLFFDTKSENFEERRAHLSRYLTFLNYVKPLAESGILILLPRRFHIVNPRLILTDAYRARIVETADFASIRRATSTKLTPTESFELQRKVYVTTAETSIICTLAEEAEHEGQLDIYVPHPYFVDVLRALVSVVADQRIDEKLPRDAFRVGELARVNLPGLESLQPDDIVSLRGNEDAFVSWRASLSRALDRIIQLPTDTFEREKEATAILKGELLESSRSLERTVQSSSALRKVRGPIRSFALGALGALATTTLSAPGPAIAAGAVTAAADLLLTFLSNKTPEGAQVLRRHFAVFEKGT